MASVSPHNYSPGDDDDGDSKSDAVGSDPDSVEPVESVSFWDWLNDIIGGALSEVHRLASACQPCREGCTGHHAGPPEPSEDATLRADVVPRPSQDGGPLNRASQGSQGPRTAEFGPGFEREQALRGSLYSTGSTEAVSRSSRTSISSRNSSIQAIQRALVPDMNAPGADLGAPAEGEVAPVGLADAWELVLGVLDDDVLGRMSDILGNEPR
mmetsp:Transcript_10600/g.39942  ORF Transcript_10600/g.39942 Transcript_10600/m.39942 type:complete len:212 (-) Transcript_10600:569-1204(-)